MVVGFTTTFAISVYHQWVSDMKIRANAFNSPFNIIPVMLWQSVLLVMETGVPGEKH
jgi:hypothetical protein